MSTLLKDEIEKLIKNLIQANQINSNKLGKAYEFRVLTDILDKKHSNGYQISCKPNDPTTLKFGESPCKPDKKKYDFIKIAKDNQAYEVWVSAEFLTVSHDILPNASTKYGNTHELDIGIFKPFIQKNPNSAYPTYQDVYEGYFCKYSEKAEKEDTNKDKKADTNKDKKAGPNKAFVREAIGLKVEMGCKLNKNKLYFYSNIDYNNFAPNLGIYNIYVKLFK